MPASAADEFEPPTELEVQVLGHLLGNLSSAALLLLGWLTFQLWRDYISTILAAFIVSQAMRRMRERMVSDVRSLRAPSEAPLLRRVGGASLRHAWACPPLLLLAVVVPLLLLADYTSWGWVGTACASAVAVVVVPVWLLDRRLLSYTALLFPSHFKTSKTLPRHFLDSSLHGAPGPLSKPEPEPEPEPEA